MFSEHYIDALITMGQTEKALQVLETYWGGMLDQGADAFWELYNPKNPQESPYGGTVATATAMRGAAPLPIFCENLPNKEKSMYDRPVIDIGTSSGRHIWPFLRF